MAIDYSVFPWISTDEFEAASVDVTRFSDDFYSGHITYLSIDDESVVQEGVSLDVPLFGSSLSEIALKINVLHSIGFFINVEFIHHGDLFDDNGDQLGTICWPSGGKLTPVGEEHSHAAEADDDSPTVTVTLDKKTLH